MKKKIISSGHQKNMKINYGRRIGLFSSFSSSTIIIKEMVCVDDEEEKTL